MTEGKSTMTIRLEKQAAKKGASAQAGATARRSLVLGDMQRVLLRGASALALSVAVASALAITLPLAVSPAHADDLVGYAGGSGQKIGFKPTASTIGGSGNGFGGVGNIATNDRNAIAPVHVSAIDGVGADGWGAKEYATGTPVYGGIGGQVGSISVGSGTLTITGHGGGDGSFDYNGGSGIQTYSTGGGGGGAGLFLNNGAGSTLTAGSSVTGGAGGAGGMLTADVAAASPHAVIKLGGGGGGGGTGIILRGTNTTLSNTVGSSIIGGAGGDGGGLGEGVDPNFVSGQIAFEAGGGGGGGGDGIVVDQGASFTNLGAVTGGKGGVGGKATVFPHTPTYNGLDGSDGAGIRMGSDTHVINNGMIAYGGNGHGSVYYDVVTNGAATQIVNAVEIVGDNNTFEIWGGSQIKGNVVADAKTTGNSFVLGGADNGTIDGGQFGGSATYADANKTQYQGFSSYAKDGAGTWTMTGLVTDNNNWTIKQGTLALSADGSIENAANVAVNAGGTLNISGIDTSTTLNNLTGAGTVALGTKDLTINDTGTQTFDGAFTGSGNLTLGKGKQTLNGNSSSFTGNTEVSSGVTLALEGKQGGNVTVASGGTMSGDGSVGGNLTVSAGGVFQSTSGVAMDVGGNLVLENNSKLDVSLGAVGSTSPLFSVTGDLTLDGTITIHDAGGFGGGIYTLIDYGGNLTGNGLTIDPTLPGGVAIGNLSISTAINHQVRLIYGVAGTVSYWNGGSTTPGNPAGGTGTWNAGGTNWLDPTGATSGTWTANNFAVFDTVGGKVTVGSPVGVKGMQFMVDGYTVSGNTPQDIITLVDPNAKPIINVGNGTTASANMTATIAAVLTGANGLDKKGLGTLILTGNNTYSGDTTISQGKLQLGDNTATGGIHGNVNIAKGAIFAIDRNDDGVNFAGNITGDGSFVKMNTNSVILSGTNTFTGGVDVQKGTLKAGSDTAFGTGALKVESGATADLNGNDLTVSGLRGSGDVALGANKLTLDAKSGDKDYLFAGNVTGDDGSTFKVSTGGIFETTGDMGAHALEVDAGSTFTFGDGITNGTFTSSQVVDNGIFAIDSSNALTVAAVLNGSGDFVVQGGGTVKLTANSNSFTGKTTIAERTTLQLGDGGTSGNLSSGIDNNGTLAFNRSDSVPFTAVIDGTGKVQQLGGGTLTLSGANTFTGGLDVENGTVNAGVENQAFGSGILTVAAGAKADLDGFNTTVAGLGGAGNVYLTDGAILTLTSGSEFDGVLDGTGGLTLQQGITTLNGLNTYSGATHIDGGVLVQGADKAFSSASACSVAANSALDLNGFTTTLASLDNTGVVELGGYGSAGTKLTVAGNYSGQNGLVAVHTVLGGDDSVTDKLVVDGDVSGTTRLQVLNDGGLGAQTVKGIEVISVGGNQPDGTFTLKGDYTTKDGQQAVVGGAYAYTLRKGTDARSSDSNWYLTNAVGPVPPTPDCHDDNSCNNPDPNPTPTPRYSAGVPVYEGYLATMQSLNKLPTLQERVGERYWTGKNGDGQSNGGIVDGRGIWARIEGAHNRFEPETTTARMKQDVNTVIMQAGVDGQFYEGDEGRWIAGITGQYGHGRADVSSFAGDGDIDTNAWSLGATSTWYGKNGFYIDGQAQVTWFDSDLDSWTANTGLASGRKATGYAASIEAGQRFALDQNWSLTPQAQLMWSSIDADAFQDTWKARVSMHDGDSLIGRLGLAVNHDSNWQAADGTSVNTSIYGIANIYQEFLGGTSVNVAGVNFDTDAEKTWAGIGAGGTYAWANSKYAIYGQGSIDTALNHFADNYVLKGTVGFKMNW